LSRFDELRRRSAARATILFAFDLIEHDGEDLRNRPFLERKAALARLLRGVLAGFLPNDHVAEAGPTVFEHACRLGAEGIVSKKFSTGPRFVKSPSPLASHPVRRGVAGVVIAHVQPGPPFAGAVLLFGVGARPPPDGV
jgi:hypothetical protein